MSQDNPGEILSMFDCFFITKVNDEFKVVKKYWFAGVPQKVWNEHLGHPELTFKLAGSFNLLSVFRNQGTTVIRWKNIKKKCK